MLHIDRLSVRFGGLKAVDEVSFDVEEGRFVGLIGPNGAGKTTFMDAVTGLVPSTGRIVLDGRDLNKYRSHQRVRAGVSRTFQSLELFEDLTVRENLLVAAERQHWWSLARDLVRPRPSASAAEAVDRAIMLLDLGAVADLLPPDLPLGRRKLVTVARALAQSPRLLLLDEPAAGLDSGEGLEFGLRMRALVEQGVTIVMIDHDMALVLRVCDRIQVLDFGKLIASGTPEEIRTSDRVIRAYLGADDGEPAAPSRSAG
ncbi:ABC transporter ATP-binding protein [Pseudonocardia sp. GCM10023141]|uniref:ABC transporter ATP-binding protein n=1 Tax=Pseudonocardia sp. GCM10023141 TaxID=3252653 RepID=UPI0036D3850E